MGGTAASGSNTGLPRSEQVGEPASEDVCRQVTPAVSAEWTNRHNPGIWHCRDRGRDSLTTTFAAHSVVAEVRLRQVPHGSDYRRTNSENLHRTEEAIGLASFEVHFLAKMDAERLNLSCKGRNPVRKILLLFACIVEPRSVIIVSLPTSLFLSA